MTIIASILLRHEEQKSRQIWTPKLAVIRENGGINIRIYDTIGEFNVDWKAEYSALSSTRSQKKKLKQPTPVPL